MKRKCPIKIIPTFKVKLQTYSNCLLFSFCSMWYTSWKLSVSFRVKMNVTSFVPSTSPETISNCFRVVVTKVKLTVSPYSIFISPSTANRSIHVHTLHRDNSPVSPFCALHALQATQYAATPVSHLSFSVQ